MPNWSRSRGLKSLAISDHLGIHRISIALAQVFCNQLHSILLVSSNHLHDLLIYLCINILCIIPHIIHLTLHDTLELHLFNV